MPATPFDPSDPAHADAARTIRAFSRLSDSQLAQIMVLGELCDYARGEDVITQGQSDKRIFFLLHGDLKVLVDGVEVARVETPGEVFGEMGVVDPAPRSATIRAADETACLSLDLGFLDSLKSPVREAVQALFFKIFYEILAGRLREANEKVADLEMQAAVLENCKFD
ncbi:Crp/Fnr family transcriptional regulator [Pseudodesulfovibrio tunisiensis]|uniref:Crp/Fnr family transcriptional regulator n=1 Tax=Pseudodesulfovibrio tunisiensis TaxID=463192 RepID=UPI001FB1F677|nr:cyclic nucleotide-binding domain-containing protein [Pseudodesulfovibrio tunisiensis]